MKDKQFTSVCNRLIAEGDVEESFQAAVAMMKAEPDNPHWPNVLRLMMLGVNSPGYKP